MFSVFRLANSCLCYCNWRYCCCIAFVSTCFLLLLLLFRHLQFLLLFHFFYVVRISPCYFYNVRVLAWAHGFCFLFFLLLVFKFIYQPKIREKQKLFLLNLKYTRLLIGTSKLKVVLITFYQCFWTKSFSLFFFVKLLNGFFFIFIADTEESLLLLFYYLFCNRAVNILDSKKVKK